MRKSKSVETALSQIKNGPSKILQLTVNGKKVSPGDHIPKANAQSPPELAFNVPSGKTYLVISLDLDAPFQSWSVLGPILHWIQPGLKPESESETATDGVAKLTWSESDTPFIANYIGPAPPPGSGPHRYVFFLYEQPADFDGAKWAPKGGKKLGHRPRMRYDLDAFEKEAKLGPVIAANYFVSN